MIARFFLILLFLLSLVQWSSIQSIWLWKFSLLSSELSLYLAGFAILFLVWFTCGARKTFRSWFFIFLAYLTFIFYISPLFSVVARLNHWNDSLVSAFGAPMGEPARPFWTWQKLFRFGEARPTFTRSTFPGTVHMDGGIAELNLDFYAPTFREQTSAPPAPWILVLHGGGWDAGDSEEFPQLNAHLSAEGYAVFAMDYELAPTRRWPAPLDNVSSALRVIRARAKEWNIDPARWVILGRSAGGQIAGVAAYSLPEDLAPRGLISIYAPTDLTFGYEIGAENDILQSRGLIRAFMGGPPEKNVELYRSASVMERATRSACPTLLLHGDNDILVGPMHSRRLESRLRELRVPEASIFVPRGPHGFDYFYHGLEASVATAAIDFFLRSVLPIEHP